MEFMKRIFNIIALLLLAVSSFAQDYSAKVRSDILPWVESKGQLFGLTDEALDSMKWDEKWLTACDKEQYGRMKALTQNPAMYYCPTGYYRLWSDRGGTFYLLGDNPLAVKTASYKTALSSVIHLERCSDGGFYLRIQGRYVGSPSRNTQVEMLYEPTKFYPIVKTPAGKVAFTTRGGGYSALYCNTTKSGSSYQITGSSADDNASLWTVSPAEDFSFNSSVTADDKYYHSFFAPFATHVEDGLEAFTLEGMDSTAVATAQLEDIPAETPVLLRSAEKQMHLSIADHDHNIVPGNLQLRNTKADDIYHDFNKVFLLWSGDKNDYTFYREYVNSSDKLYFWQQALVILMVEDRYDFRGDPSTVSLITQLLDAFMHQEGTINSQGICDYKWNEYNDDLLWAGLAFIRGYKITGQERFLKQAIWTWDLMYNRGWDDELDGGIWWSIKKEEKSGLSNNPAVCMAAYLYDATGEQQYLDKAIAIHDWVQKKLRKSDGAVSEKIDADGTVSTSYNVYNMGTFVEGTAALYRLTGERKYITLARKTIEYVMVNRTDANGIVSHSSKYDGTYQSEFARGMAFWLKANPADWKYNGYYTTSRIRITYYKWMRKNADAAYNTRNPLLGISNCEWTKATPLMPSGGKDGWQGKGWECDACVSSVVMLQVTPEVQPGAKTEVYVDIDDNSQDFAYKPQDAETENNIEVDEEGIMRVGIPLILTTVGNSITEGYRTSSSLMAWPKQLERQAGGMYEVVNCGVSGTTMGRNTDSPYWNTGRFTTAKNSDPQILIIALGTNDAATSSNRWAMWGSTFKEDYLAMVEEFRQNGRDPILYLVLATPKFPVATDGQNKIIRDEMIPIVKEVAAEVGATTIDFYTPMVNQESLFPDNLHPGDEGSGKLATIALQALQNSLKITPDITVSNGRKPLPTVAVVKSGSTVTLKPSAPVDGTWSWSGPDGFTATSQNVKLTNVTKGGIYRCTFTDGEGRRAMVNFLVTLQGTTAGTFKPYVNIAGAGWTQQTQIEVRPSQSITFGPQCGDNNGHWVWQGPNRFFQTGREITLSAITTDMAGKYGVTFTDSQGQQSTEIFDVKVDF